MVPFTGSGFADVLLGMPSFLSNQYNRGFFYFRQTEAGLYFTDQWRVNSRLTLNLGLRWDKWTPYREKYNRLVVPDINSVFDKFEVVTPGDNRIQDLPGIPPAVLESWSRRGLTYTTAQAAGMPDNLFRADNNNFGPRLGAAFQISKKTVLRGAYGEYFWTMPLSQILQSSRNNAPLNLRFTTDVYGKNANFNYPLVSRPAAVDIIPATTVDTEGIVEISDRPSLATIWDARNWKDGRSQTWHATVEHQFPYATAVRLSYIGSHGSDLEQQFELNTREAEYNYVARTGLAPPNNRDLLRRNKDWNFIGINRTGYSNTHSGQVEVERRFSGGVAFQWFYTFTRSLTTTDSGGFESGNTGINSGGGGGRVPEVQQIQGAPDLSYDERLRRVYFNSTTIPAHRIRYNAIVDLPFGKGKRFGTDSTCARSSHRRLAGRRNRGLAQRLLEQHRHQPVHIWRPDARSRSAPGDDHLRPTAAALVPRRFQSHIGHECYGGRSAGARAGRSQSTSRSSARTQLQQSGAAAAGQRDLSQYADWGAVQSRSPGVLPRPGRLECGPGRLQEPPDLGKHSGPAVG